MGRPRKSPRGAAATRDSPAASAASPVAEEAPNEPQNVCGNPFCGAVLTNRVTKYCEDKPNCQRYRAVFLHCAFRRVLARAGQIEGEGEAEGGTHGVDDEAFSIPRRKRKMSDDDAPLQVPGAKKKKKDRSQRKSKEAAARSRSPSDGQDAVPTEMRVRRRHIQQHVEAAASAAASGQQGSAVSASAASAAAGETARPAGSRAATAAQAVKQMDIEIVALGASNQATNFAGGGRYVQSGNRTAGPTLVPPPPVTARPPPPPPPPSVSRPPLPPKAPYNPMSAAADVPVARQAGSAPSGVPYEPSSAVPQDPRASSTSTPNGIFNAGSASRTQSPFPNSSASNPVANNGSSRPSTMRISAADYISARRVHETAGSVPASTGSSSTRAAVPPPHPPASERYPYPRDNYRSDSPDLSFSDFEQPTGREFAPPPARSSAPAAAQADYRRESSERAPLSRSLSHSDDRSRLPPPPNTRPDYRRSYSDSTAQQSSSHRDDRYVQSSTGDAYRNVGDYPEERRRDSTSYRSVDDIARAEEYARVKRDANHRDPRQDRFDNGYQRDRLSPREASVGPRPHLDAGGVRREEREQQAVRPAPSVSSDVSASSSTKSSPYEIEPPKFSYHDKFVADLVSVMICEIPHAIGAVMNETKKARKMKWYLDYVDRAAKLFGPDVSIEIKNHKAVMLVKQCEWLVIEDMSTTSLYTRVLHRLLDEALMWRHMREEAEARLSKARRDFGSGADLGITFIQAWNLLKTFSSTGFIPLEKQVRYFCGTRKHHWSFSVGNVEIGSGSHEDKRMAFNFATTASMKFLLSLRSPETQRQHLENSSSSRERSQVSSERSDRDDRDRSDRDDRDRRYESRLVEPDRRRSETRGDVGSGASRSPVVAAQATEPSRSNGPSGSLAGLPTEDKRPSINSDGVQGSSGAGSARTVVGQAASRTASPVSFSGNRADPAVVTDTDVSDVPGQPVDPRLLRRPPTDPRLRRPPLPNPPRTVGSASDPRTQVAAPNPRTGATSKPTTQRPTADPRTRVAPRDPRRSPAIGSAAPASIGANAAIARPIDPSEDEMSISDDSDRERKTARQAPSKPQPTLVPTAQDTTCHFCAMIRLSKPDAVDAKCFRCQAKTASGTV